MISVFFDLLYRLAGMDKHSIETVRKWEQGKRNITEASIELMRQFEEGRRYALQENSSVIEESQKSNYSIPSQMELIAITRQQQEEISRLKSIIIELQEELLVKKNRRDVKDA
jgi:transcriptional regulator with XRE-family HTH domain